MSLPRFFSALVSVLTVMLAFQYSAYAKAPNAETIVLSSPVEQATLLELYTSEGCSSCPPADRWLSEFKNDKKLWQKIVPVAFHVDYWDYLGWRDRFSDARYSQRQSDYRKHDYLDVVYTPGMVKNGREFRGWRGFIGRDRDKSVFDKSANKAGILKAEISENTANIEFTPIKNQGKTLTLNIAILAFDQKTEVAGGENGGRELIHDFVVLDHSQHKQRAGAKTTRWTLGKVNKHNLADASGIALWVTAGNDPTPIQATGGWLR